MMQTANNLYPASGDPYKRFVKTVEYAITGWRLDDQGKSQAEFVLASPLKEFDYEMEVLEVYSEKEYKFLLQKNRYLFQSGLLKEYDGAPDEVDMSNILSDDEIFALASTRLPNDLKSKLSAITSHVTVKRVKHMAEEVGRPIKILSLINERIEQLRV